MKSINKVFLFSSIATVSFLGVYGCGGDTTTIDQIFPAPTPDGGNNNTPDSSMGGLSDARMETSVKETGSMFEAGEDVLSSADVGTDSDSSPPEQFVVCGSTQISTSVFGSACGANTNGSTVGFLSNGDSVCGGGTVQCQLVADSGLQKVCADSNGTSVVVPANDNANFSHQTASFAGNRCDQDLDCNGTADNTAGVGSNSMVIRPVGSMSDGDGGTITIPGLCRNAKMHCLVDVDPNTLIINAYYETLWNGNVPFTVGAEVMMNPNYVPVEGTEGTDLADYGLSLDEGGNLIINNPTADEMKMGAQCLAPNGTDILTWDCQDVNGQAVVNCSGARP